jgi:predicted DNA-binding transcriptional regulator AlpA
MKRGEILPASLPPVGINREQAAALIGISSTLFDRLVRDNRMPDARAIEGRLVWDVAEVVDAFRSLPHRSEPIDHPTGTGNAWDDAKAQA